jgi:hypothetical protein
MSISTYSRPNIHQKASKILGVKTAQMLKDKVLKKNFFLSTKSWVLLSSIFVIAHGCARCHLPYNHSDLNVKSLIFFKEILQVP